MKKDLFKIITIISIILIIFPAFISEDNNFAIYKRDPIKIYGSKSKFATKPSKKHLLGLDKNGRDTLSRLLLATRNALLFAFSYTLISALIGIFLGVILGLQDNNRLFLFSKLVESLETLPFSYLALVLLYYFGESSNGLLFVIFFLIIFKGWIKYCYFSKNITLKLKNLDYIKVPKTFGASNLRIIFKHILPEVFAEISSLLPLSMANSLATFEALNYIKGEDKVLYPTLGGFISYVDLGPDYMFIWLPPIIIMLLVAILLNIFNFYLKRKILNKI